MYSKYFNVAKVKKYPILQTTFPLTIFVFQHFCSMIHPLLLPRHHPPRPSVTAVGCGIAGYTPGEVAPLFREATALANVYLPHVFWEVL